MEAVTNGGFSEKDSSEEKTVDNPEVAPSNLSDRKNGAIPSDKENCSNVPNSELTSSLTESSKETNLPDPEKDPPADAKAVELECGDSNENPIKSVLGDLGTNFIENSADNSNLVDSLKLLNNSVQKISSLFNQSPDNYNNEAAIKPFASSVIDRTDPVKSVFPIYDKSKSIDQLDRFTEPLAKDSDTSEKSHSENSEFENSKLSEKSKDTVSESSPVPCTAGATDQKESCSEMSETSNLNLKNPSDENSILPPVSDLKLKPLGNDVQNLSLKPFSQNNLDSCTSKIESSKDSTSSQDREKELDSFVFTEISNEETGFPEVFTGLVTMGKYISVKGDFTLRSSEALVESPSLVAPYLLKEPDSFPARASPLKNDSRGFFFSAAGELLIGIGLSRVSEWYHRDMTKIKKRQMKKEGKSPQLEDDLKLHEEFYAEAKKANRMYSFPLKTCKTCEFSTESAIVMEGHLLVPHINARREFECNFCDVFNRDPRIILEHMFRIHAKTGRIQPPNAFFECPYCTFETNSKVKLGNHLTKCQRFYDANRNQTPPKDFEFPALTPKPITVAVVKAYEKSLSSMQRGRGRPKKIDSISDQMSPFGSVNQSAISHNSIPPYRPSSTSVLSEGLSNLSNQLISPMQMSNISLRPPPHSGMNQFRTGVNPMHLPNPNRMFHVNSSSQMMPIMGNNSFVTTQSQFPFNPTLVNSGKKLSTHTPNFLNTMFGTGLRQQQNPKASEVTITPLPKLQGPYPVPHVKSSMPPNNTSMQGNSLVVCEICDGYIKDLEQLRSHMQLIHKVKIHPKMLVSRPPLNCQKCQWRFFTDQGLERHLLGSHGLVTSNMQELANKGKDAGCCTICGRVYASKLVSHMNQVHKLTLKPAHLSYKCTVCSATFNLYRLFENHVYLVHSGAAKRSSDSSSNATKKLKSLDMDSGNLHLDDNLSEESDSVGKCKECGTEFVRISAQTEKCEKCLGFDRQGGLVKGMVS